MSMFEIYKRTQGKYTRMGTFIAGGLLGAIGARWLSGELNGMNPLLQYGIPVLVLAAIAFLLFRVVNKPRMADFMIATEGEMKKVSWSSRREVVGSTKVVIFTTFALAVILFAVDIVFRNFFGVIGVLRMGQQGG